MGVETRPGGAGDAMVAGDTTAWTVTVWPADGEAHLHPDAGAARFDGARLALHPDGTASLRRRSTTLAGTWRPCADAVGFALTSGEAVPMWTMDGFVTTVDGHRQLDAVEILTA